MHGLDKGSSLFNPHFFVIDKNMSDRAKENEKQGRTKIVIFIYVYFERMNMIEYVMKTKWRTWFENVRIYT